jgi:hypothetical protein
LLTYPSMCLNVVTLDVTRNSGYNY